jgi:L-ascorbate metabolism protein UlaG (beta-lactamase superfamily)
MSVFKTRWIKKCLFLVFVLFILSCVSNSKYPKSDHYNGDTFYHRWSDSPKSLWTVLKWRWTADRKEWPKVVENKNSPNFSNELGSNQLEVTYVNHATVYVRHNEIAFLTDPIWSNRTSPVSFAGPKRIRQPGVQIDKLPSLDYVFISHNHYDHLDIETLQQLNKIYKPIFFVPLGDRDLLLKNRIENVVELDWWSKSSLKNDVELYFAPTRHWSARGISDRNKSLWGSYVFKTKQNKKIYFAGDTGYCDVFAELSNKYGPMDFSLIPIGAYEPRWFMKESHVNPDEAVQIHLDLQSKKSMGIHFGTFQLTDEGFEEPVNDLEKAKKQKSIPEADFFAPEVGKTYLLEI